MDVQKEMERLLRKRNRRWRTFFRLFPIVPQLFMLLAIIAAFCIVVYQDGLSQILSEIKNGTASDFLTVFGIMGGLLLLLVWFCHSPLKELKKQEKAADFMMECFSKLPLSVQRAVFKETQNTVTGHFSFSQSSISFNSACLCATGVLIVPLRLRMLYPVAIPYGKIARVSYDPSVVSPQKIKKDNLYTVASLALTVAGLFAGIVGVVYPARADNTPIRIVDIDGNQYGLTCDSQIAREYAEKIMAHSGVG